MKKYNNSILLLFSLVIIFGIAYLIRGNRINRAKERKEELVKQERVDFVKDSITRVNTMNSNKINSDKNKNTYRDNQNNKNKTDIIEDYSKYINNSLTNTPDNIEVSVTIVDINGNILTSVSHSIAEIYSQSGKIGNTGLIRSSFINKSEFQELFEGNSDIIDKLKLNEHTDYLAIGKLEYISNSGSLVNGSFVTNSTLTMSIIYTKIRAISKSFTIAANGNGVNERQAKEYALQNLLNKFSDQQYSSTAK